MALRERFHRALYLGLQRTRRRPIGRLVRRLREWERLDRTAYETLVTHRLLHMLAYAREHVPLYAAGPGRGSGTRRPRTSWIGRFSIGGS